MARKVEFDYVPTPKQDLFHSSTEDELLYGGAAGGGKSKAIVMEAFLRCAELKGCYAYLFRRTYRELEDTLVKEALKGYPRGMGKYVGDAHEYRMYNGSVIKFRHLDHENDKYEYQGHEIHFLGFDEITHFTLSQYDYLKSRVRTDTKLGANVATRCTGNPGGIGHAWVKSHFVDGNKGGGTKDALVWSETLQRHQLRTIRFIPATVLDNPHLGEDYIFELETKPPALRKALLEGNWDAFEGQAFPEFIDDPRHYRDGMYTHVIQPFPIPADWRRYRSFDFGYSRPFSVGWWALSPGGRLYRTHEWYGCVADPRKVGSNVGARISPDIIGKEIAKFEAKNFPGVNILGVADPSIFDESRGESISRQMEKHGVFFEAGDNTRLAGKMQMHYRLQFDDTGRPMVYFFTNCRNSIRTIPALVYNDRNIGMIEDIDTLGEDHIYDDCRYMFMTNPIAPKPPQERILRVPNPLDMDIRGYRHG